MKVQCASLSLNLYSVVTDLSRIWDHQEDPWWLFSFKDFEKVTVALLVFLLLFLIAMPLIAIRRARRDYKSFKQEIIEVDEGTLKKVAVVRRQPIDEILYKVRLI